MRKQPTVAVVRLCFMNVSLLRSPQLRPRRRWFVVAMAFALGWLAFVAWGFHAFVFSALPQRTFAAGETVSMRLDPGERMGFYVDQRGTPGDRCQAYDQSGRPVPVQPETSQVTLTIKSTTWHGLWRLDVPVAGTYRLTCLKNASNADARYAVGSQPQVSDLATAVVGGFTCFGAAAATTIVVLIRRNAHRRQLTQIPAATPPH
ncbi:hypothetical protein [Actinomadura rudentiformis]|uniref:Uncharacterized protein n=1 Tax=Actinomadura rudentiformis TaxID=359158 RepID=A0A6H9YA88_9ACTN|nr:hypothetical protein [Actinomadura rudentiformis]KAB2340597.1 hypothetical protein F8566_44555 [Actinomadura rudentiformis]